MANIKDNKKGFKVIQISRKELVEELGQYGAIGICDYCNETASTNYPAQREQLALPPGIEADEACEYSITTMEDT